jgi:hypothetical protein
MNNDFYNASGCADPTAYEAIRNLQRKEARRNARRLIKALKKTIAENDFLLLNRIELKDKTSGIVFK